MKLNQSMVMKKLCKVLDPELGISIVDMGLVYCVTIDSSKVEHSRNSKVQNPKPDSDSRVKILMTLTTVGCPLISVIEQDIKNKIHELGVKEKDITIKLTFDPPWTIDKMSKKAKKKLGI